MRITNSVAPDCRDDYEMKLHGNVPRCTIKCHGDGCETIIETTVTHRHDGLCKPCGRKRHSEKTRQAKLDIKNGVYQKGKPGRRPYGGGSGEILPVVCKCCNKPIADCNQIKPELSEYKPSKVETWKPWK